VIPINAPTLHGSLFPSFSIGISVFGHRSSEQGPGQTGSRPPAGQEAWSPEEGSDTVENAVRAHLSAGKGILKMAVLLGVGSGTVQRVGRIAGSGLAEAA
jgi:hypothetical protein